MVFNLLQNEKELYKKIMQLIEDSYILTENKNEGMRIGRLKVNFLDTGIKCFYDLRKCTSLLVNSFPLVSEIDENLICSLPDDTFDSYKEVNEELTLKTLKVIFN